MNAYTQKAGKIINSFTQKVLKRKTKIGIIKLIVAILKMVKLSTLFFAILIVNRIRIGVFIAQSKAAYQN